MLKSIAVTLLVLTSACKPRSFNESDTESKKKAAEMTPTLEKCVDPKIVGEKFDDQASCYSSCAAANAAIDDPNLKQRTTAFEVHFKSARALSGNDQTKLEDLPDNEVSRAAKNAYSEMLDARKVWVDASNAYSTCLSDTKATRAALIAGLKQKFDKSFVRNGRTLECTGTGLLRYTRGLTQTTSNFTKAINIPTCSAVLLSCESGKTVNNKNEYFRIDSYGAKSGKETKLPDSTYVHSSNLSLSPCSQ